MTQSVEKNGVAWLERKENASQGLGKTRQCKGVADGGRRRCRGGAAELERPKNGRRRPRSGSPEGGMEETAPDEPAGGGASPKKAARALMRRRVGFRPPDCGGTWGGIRWRSFDGSCRSRHCAPDGVIGVEKSRRKICAAGKVAGKVVGKFCRRWGFLTMVTGMRHGH